MIISAIKWGMGNQLFQYAIGLSLANRHNVPLVLDITSYDEDSRREFCLKYFKINNLLTDVSSTDEELVFDLYREPHFRWDKNFLQRPNFTYITGNWQSYKYFEHIRPILLNNLQVRNEFTAHLDIRSLGMHQCDSVSIHIRRTDYAQHENLNMLPLSYYYKAINYFQQQTKKMMLYIFSDDVAWVCENFLLDIDHVFVSDNYTKHNIEDFYLMQQCKYHIIANSTFSWWAAWLCNHQDKKVIAPLKWFKVAHEDTGDLLPKNWLTL